MSSVSPVFDPTVFAPRFRRSSLPEPDAPRVTNVRWYDGAHHPIKRVRGVKRLGLQYERRVLDVLEAIYGSHFQAHPGISYRVRGEPMRAFPDGLLRLGDTIIIVEIKLAHTDVVWEQLMGRYLTLVRTLEPQRTPRTVEICRSYDPTVMLPGPHTLITSLHQPRAKPSLEVLRWKI